MNLTPKQFIVLQLSAQGYAGKEIAEKLGIGLKSVISRKHQVFKKLGAQSAPHAVNIAWQRGIFTKENIHHQ